MMVAASRGAAEAVGALLAAGMQIQRDEYVNLSLSSLACVSLSFLSDSTMRMAVTSQSCLGGLVGPGNPLSLHTIYHAAENKAGK